MTSCEAIGPPVMVWCPCTTVVTTWLAWKLSITPEATRTSPPTTASGIRYRSVILVMSTQKLPSLSVLDLMKPRTSAIAITMPTAADRKFCTARPHICTM